MSLGLIIPAYIYPDGKSYQILSALSRMNSKIDVEVIFNPASGPGTGTETIYPDLKTATQQIAASGAFTWGYIALNYGGFSQALIESQIRAYASLYADIAGIWFDEFPATTGSEAYVAELTTYAKSLGFARVGGNPGTAPVQTYVGTVDVLNVFEGDTFPASVTAPISDRNGLSIQSYAIAAASAPTQAAFDAVAKTVKYINITDAALPNPYSALSTWLWSLEQLITGSAYF